MAGIWDAMNRLNPNMGQVDQWKRNETNAVSSITNKGLFDPEILKQLQGILQPYFDQQMSNLNQSQTSALADARRAGGSYAASQGYDNPFSFINKAQSGVYGSFAPQFGNLQADQLGMLLNASAQNQQFKNQNFWRLDDAYRQNRQLGMMEDSQNFNFFRDLFPGLLGGGFSLGAAALGRK